MLVVRRASRHITERVVRHLPDLLEAGDLLVVNDAAALPASLMTADGGVEFRLTGPVDGGRVPALAFGTGSWRTRTEDRGAPPAMRVHDRYVFEGGLKAHLDAVDGRQVVLHFEGPSERVASAIYAAGRPIQYAYLNDALELWDVQTSYAGRPWAVEAPSAGFGVTFEVLSGLRRRGIGLARVTHAAGLSSTGEGALDRQLPLPERFEVPEDTVQTIARTRARGGRVIAVGTSVVRALEGAYVLCGSLRAGAGVTNLRITPDHRLQIVDGLLTGVHEPTESHFALLSAFADPSLLERVHAEAERRGLLRHEFGDACLLLPD